MTTAERTYINRALGPEVDWAEARPDPAAWRALAHADRCAASDLIVR